MRTTCVQCGSVFHAVGKRGRTPTYCSAACRQRAYRARKAAAPRFPEELREEQRWVRADHKRPIRVNGSAASSVNPSTWSLYSDVLSGPGDGYGVMLGGGYACIDLDDCFDERGKPTGIAAAVLRKNPKAFVERSMSGRGLHVFGLLPEAVGIRRDGMEVYSMARFIRVTEDVYRPGILTDLVIPDDP